MIKWIGTSRLSIKNSLWRDKCTALSGPLSKGDLCAEGGLERRSLEREAPDGVQPLDLADPLLHLQTREFKLPWREAGPPNQCVCVCVCE